MLFLSGSRVPEELSVLEDYARNPSDRARNDNLSQLCKTAGRIRRKIDGHPADWTFGPWDRDVAFPSVLSDGAVVVNAQLE